MVNEFPFETFRPEIQDLIFRCSVAPGNFLFFSTVLATEFNHVLIFKEPIEGKMLPGHVIRTEEVANEGSCRVRCFLEPNCVSINVGPADDQGKRTCELRGYPLENHAKGATVHITELAQTFHIGITWWSIGRYGISFVQASFFSFFQGGYPWTAKSTLKYVQIL